MGFWLNHAIRESYSLAYSPSDVPIHPHRERYVF